MKRVNFVAVIASLMLIGLMTGCGGKEPGIKMTMKAEGNVTFSIAGNKVYIDWGDGSAVESVSDADIFSKLEHNYPKEAVYTIKITGDNITELICHHTEMTSLVINNATLDKLECFDNQLTVLDVSKCPELTDLSCGGNQLSKLDISNNPKLKKLECTTNMLTGLDVSRNAELEMLVCPFNSLKSLDVKKNAKLNILYCRTNQLSAKALDALFESLHENQGDDKIDISDNPGTDDCNKSIAEKKGWEIDF